MAQQHLPPTIAALKRRRIFSEPNSCKLRSSRSVVSCKRTRLKHSRQCPQVAALAPLVCKSSITESSTEICNVSSWWTCSKKTATSCCVVAAKATYSAECQLKGEIYHFKFAEDQKEYKFDGPSFRTLIELLQYYYEKGKVISQDNRVRLRNPVQIEFDLIERSRLRLEKQLGAGNFGQVWKGKLKVSGKPDDAVAVKILSGESSELDRKECLAEARIMSSMDHENVTKIKGVCFAPPGDDSPQPQLMLILELCTGGSLDKMLEKNLVTEKDKVKSLFDSSKGLAYQHERDIIHRVKLERVHAAGGGSAAPSFSTFLRQRNAGGTLEQQHDDHGGQQAEIESDRETEEYVFKWQEKIFSQREYSLYASEANCETVLQKQYREDILRMRQTVGRPTRRLFTYIEGDDFLTLEDHMEQMSIGGGTPSFLVEKMANVRHRRVAPRPHGRANLYQEPVIDVPTAEAIKKAHTLPQFKYTMHLMADLGPMGTAAPDRKDEHVLCTIRVYNDRLLSVQPNFNFCTKPPYKIKSRLGDFQYTVENTSAKLTFEDLLSQKKADASLHDYRASVQRSLVGVDFDVPEDGVFKTFYFGEILAARGFEYSNLFVHYFVELPAGWYSATGRKTLWGVTHTCKTGDIAQNEVAYFSYPFEFELCCNTRQFESEASHTSSWPQIFFEVLSCDNFGRLRTEGYSYQTLPTSTGPLELNLNTWRPVSGSTQSELRRFFIGGTADLDEMNYVQLPKLFEGNKISKFGFRTVSCGMLQVRLHTAFQSREFISAERQQQLRYGALLEKIGAGVGLRSSIISVLEAFQRARQRMIAVRDNIYAEQGFFPA